MNYTKKNVLVRIIALVLVCFLFQICTTFSSSAEFQSNEGTTIFLVDNSGSMDKAYNGDLKINAAKDSIRNALNSIKNNSMKMGLIELGGHCEAKELVNPKKSDIETMKNALEKVRPRPYGDSSTPIAEGISKASKILMQNPAPHKIVLVSDGEANCMGDNEFPLSACDMVASLKRQNINFQLSLIGYGVSDIKNEQAKCIASLSDKVYKPKKPSELDAALKKELKISDATDFFKSITDFCTSLQGTITAIIALGVFLYKFIAPKKKTKSLDEFWR
jgi:hypothetical protein